MTKPEYVPVVGAVRLMWAPPLNVTFPIEFDVIVVASVVRMKVQRRQVNVEPAFAVRSPPLMMTTSSVKVAVCPEERVRSLKQTVPLLAVTELALPRIAD